MKLDAHGGDLLAMASVSKRDPASLLDFSVNVRPEGAPEFLRAALVRANTGLAAYPSPNAEEALAAAARRYGLPAGRFAFGNGSNELIHALARVLKRRGAPCVSIVEPAFSEYALACRLAGLESSPLWGGIGSGADGQPSGDLLAGLAETPSGSAVFLANPCNPSGLFRTPGECLSLLAARPDLLWIIDEAFIEYAGPEADVSILRRMPSNGVVLRSLTKFHALPGVRIGYLAASAELAEAVRADLPAWNVNVFALSAAVAALGDTSDFAERARAENAERRADLAAVLSGLPGVEVFPSSANYVLFRWRGAPKDLYGILLRRFGIAVRDCSNYCGLDDGTWFRAAVRFPEEHHRLAGALREVMEEGDVPKKSAADTPLLAYGGMKSREEDEGDLSLKKISPSPADFPISFRLPRRALLPPHSSPHAAGNLFKRGQEHPRSGLLPHLPARRLQCGPVQGSEHVPEFGRHGQWRRDEPGTDRASAGGPRRPRCAHESHSAQAALGYGIASRHPRAALGTYGRPRIFREKEGTLVRRHRLL